MSRDVSRFAPSQWETALLCNVVSHWRGASLESTLNEARVLYQVQGFQGLQKSLCGNVTLSAQLGAGYIRSTQPWRVIQITFWNTFQVNIPHMLVIYHGHIFLFRLIHTMDSIFCMALLRQLCNVPLRHITWLNEWSNSNIQWPDCRWLYEDDNMGLWAK